MLAEGDQVFRMRIQTLYVSGSRRLLDVGMTSKRPGPKASLEAGYLSMYGGPQSHKTAIFISYSTQKFREYAAGPIVTKVKQRQRRLVLGIEGEMLERSRFRCTISPIARDCPGEWGLARPHYDPGFFFDACLMQVPEQKPFKDLPVPAKQVTKRDHKQRDKRCDGLTAIATTKTIFEKGSVLT